MKSISDTAEPYSTLAAVYDKWTADNDYDRWLDFIKRQLNAAHRQVTTVLELCCGTGAMTRRLQSAGYEITGIDRSAAMLERARAGLRRDTRLVLGELPAVQIEGKTTFDAVVCCFDSVNYFVDPGTLPEIFLLVGNALAARGRFIFDVNSRYKLEAVFGSSQYGDDAGDYAYVWRNRRTRDQQVDFLITLFIREGQLYRRVEERHTQRWFDHDEIRSAAQSGGMRVLSVTDDYGLGPLRPETLRETWVLERIDERLGASCTR